MAATGRLERDLRVEQLELGVGRWSDQDHGEVSALVEEEQALVAAELADETEGCVHRSGCGPLAKSVGAVDVRQAAVAAQLVGDPLPSCARADPSGPAGSIDHQVGVDPPTVHERAADPATFDHQTVDVPGAQLQSGLLSRGLSQRTLQGLLRECTPLIVGSVAGCPASTGVAPRRIQASNAAGHSWARSLPTCGRKLCACANCMTPLSPPGPVGGTGRGPGRPTMTWWPRPRESRSQDEPGRSGPDDQQLA